MWLKFVSNVSVVLEHRATACDVNDDGIQRGVVEGGGVCVHEFESRIGSAGVVVDCAAAGLSAGDVNIAAVVLQDASGGPVNVPEHGVSNAADKEPDLSAAGTDGREEFRELRRCGFELWQL
jgi:hypothetical protein